MTLELNQFSSQARARQIALGRRFGSGDTLNQANQTLASYHKHGPALAAYGFHPKDAERLTDARDMLSAAGVERGSARGSKSINSKVLADAMRRAQGVRLRARVVLSSIQEDLEEVGADAAERSVAGLLQMTAVAGDTAESLATQLDLIADLFAQPAVAQAATERGVADIVTAIERISSELRDADQKSATVRGTPEETQRLDQLDGIIVRLTRRARKAALAAARELSDPALAHAFKLNQLYRSRGGSADDAPDDAPGDTPGDTNEIDESGDIDQLEDGAIDVA